MKMNEKEIHCNRWLDIAITMNERCPVVDDDARTAMRGDACTDPEAHSIMSHLLTDVSLIHICNI